jgi:hypothetical protein
LQSVRPELLDVQARPALFQVEQYRTLDKINGLLALAAILWVLTQLP